MKRIFIVGVGRSGTSLLHAILSAHNDIAAIPETGIIRRGVFDYETDFFNDHRLKRLDNLPEISKETSRSEILKIYLKYSSSCKENIIVDKDPRLVEYLEQLNNSIEDIKIVNIIRDPRDVLSSKKKASWSKGRTLLSYLVASHVQLEDAFNYHHGNIFHIYYEDLLLKPEEELKNLCIFLNIEFSDKMLDHTEASHLLVQKDEMSWKKETLEPINKRNIGNWRNNLSEIETLSSIYVYKSAVKKESRYTFKEHYSLSTRLIAKSFSALVTVIAKLYSLKRRFI
ncbi:sulfotransferase [Vibrio sp. 10N.222.54.B12]|uniref:sulfotransferase family protein n=1 Tax=Vibrio sp. 10N.222.54.B12 TaxID=3229636 RepID=UPI0035516E7B